MEYKVTEKCSYPLEFRTEDLLAESAFKPIEIAHVIAFAVPVSKGDPYITYIYKNIFKEFLEDTTCVISSG